MPHVNCIGAYATYTAYFCICIYVRQSAGDTTNVGEIASPWRASRSLSAERCAGQFSRAARTIAPRVLGPRERFETINNTVGSDKLAVRRFGRGNRRAKRRNGRTGWRLLASSTEKRFAARAGDDAGGWLHTAR